MYRNQYPRRRNVILNRILNTVATAFMPLIAAFKVISRIKKRVGSILLANVHFLNWRARDVLFVWWNHPLPCVLTACVFFLLCLEYTSRMIPASSPPTDLGFIATKHFNAVLASRPTINAFLAGLNTVFVVMQALYILWTWLIEGRPRLMIATLFMVTSRGILGYSIQLPLPEDFLGSGMVFPVGNLSFFLFFSGHVAASVMVSRDMRRMERWKLAYAFDYLNLLQIMRLLSTRGHYTIDLMVGIGAGLLCDFLAEKYEQNKIRESLTIRIKGMIYGGYCSCRIWIIHLSLRVLDVLKKIMRLGVMVLKTIIGLSLMVLEVLIKIMRLGLMVLLKTIICLCLMLLKTTILLGLMVLKTTICLGLMVLKTTICLGLMVFNLLKTIYVNAPKVIKAMHNKTLKVLKAMYTLRSKCNPSQY